VDTTAAANKGATPWWCGSEEGKGEGKERGEE
jgi:hypothetical protein